jgi:hypothetical protein
MPTMVLTDLNLLQSAAHGRNDDHEMDRASSYVEAQLCFSLKENKPNLNGLPKFAAWTTSNQRTRLAKKKMFVWFDTRNHWLIDNCTVMELFLHRRYLFPDKRAYHSL